MWKPPERIKYQTTVARWPTQEEAVGSRLYSSLSTPNLSLGQRTWVPAMVPWRASEEGDVTQDVIDWYARFAEGMPGAIVVEATGIRDIPSGPLLRISDERYVAGLRRLTDAVREASGGRTRLLIQLIDFLTIRRRPQHLLNPKASVFVLDLLIAPAFSISFSSSSRSIPKLA